MEELKKGVGREYDSADSVHYHVLCHSDFRTVKKDKVEDPEFKTETGSRNGLPALTAGCAFGTAFFVAKKSRKRGRAVQEMKRKWKGTLKRIGETELKERKKGVRRNRGMGSGEGIC